MVVRAYSRIFLLILCCCSILFSGCTEKELEKEGDDLKISISVDELFQEQAYLRIRHNGSSDDLWLCFVTDDLSVEPGQFFEERLAQTIDFYGTATANSGTNRSIPFTGLDSRSTYMAVAAIVTEYGEISSNVAELDFTTLRDPDIFYTKEDWNMTYSGRQPFEGNQDEYHEYFSCSAPDGALFYPCVVSRQEFDIRYSGNIRTCFETIVGERNSENVKWGNVLVSGEGSYDCSRLFSGDYIAFMIGMTEEGELTGDYSASDFVIEQEEQTDEYAYWVGLWNITGDAGENTVSYTVRIEAVENNLMYNMYGWEGTTAYYYEEVPNNNPIPIYFEASTGNAYIYSISVGQVQSIANFYVFGNIVVDGEICPVPIEGMKLAYFSYENGKPYLNAASYSFDLDGYSYSGEFKSFAYAYSLAGFEYMGYASLTKGALVPDLLGIKVVKLN